MLLWNARVSRRHICAWWGRQNRGGRMADEPTEIEIQVIQDVIETVEERLRRYEQRGGQVLTTRSRIYAVVVHAVVVSARERALGATLDNADVLDYLLDGVECGSFAQNPSTDVIGLPGRIELSRLRIRISGETRRRGGGGRGVGSWLGSRGRGHGDGGQGAVAAERRDDRAGGTSCDVRAIRTTSSR